MVEDYSVFFKRNDARFHGNFRQENTKKWNFHKFRFFQESDNYNFDEKSNNKKDSFSLVIDVGFIFSSKTMG